MGIWNIFKFASFAASCLRLHFSSNENQILVNLKGDRDNDGTKVAFGDFKPHLGSPLGNQYCAISVGVGSTVCFSSSFARA